jgi:hypothetical protein
LTDSPEPFDNEEATEQETYARLEELDKLETIIEYMEELGITTLEAARTRYTELERSLANDDDE